MQTLLIGAGYLGTALLQRWFASGSREPASVGVTTRSPERLAHLAAKGVNVVRFDVLDEAATLPKCVEVVYAVGFDRRLGLPMRAIYVDGLRRTLAKIAATATIVYVSSTGVYGDQLGEWITEETEPNPVDEAGKVCLEAEVTLQTCRPTAIIVRSAGIYGPGRMIGAQGLIEQKPIAGDPETSVNLIHVDDLAGIVDTALNVGIPGNVYLASDGQPVLRRAFYEYTAELLQAPSPVFDSTLPRRHRGDRKINSRWSLEQLRYQLIYPSYREGMRQAMASMVQP